MTVETSHNGTALIDVAFGKRAFQSSTSVWSRPHEASLAVLGDAGADFCFHTDEEDDPWWMVDLGSSYPIRTVVVHNRLLVPERAYALNVELSDDGRDWRLMHAGPSVFTRAEPLVVQGDGATRGRFVKLSLPERQSLHLGPVHVLVDRTAVLEAEFDLAVTGGQVVAKQIRVGVLGTSNSLSREGYVASLGLDPDVAVVGNASLGSCHAVVLPMRLPAIEAARPDYLVVDLAVNEEGASWHGLYNYEVGAGALTYLLHWCAERAVVPIVVILPFLPSAEGYCAVPRRMPRSLEHYRSFCRRFGVPFLDGYDLVARIADAWKKPVGFFFDDTYHLKRFMQVAMGRILAEGVKQVAANGHVDLGEADVGELVYLPASAAAREGGSPLLTRKNSIIDERTIVLGEGEQARFDTGPHADVVGLAINMAATNAGLRFVERDVVKRLDSGQDFGLPFILVAWSLISPVPAGSVTTVRCETVGSGQAGVEGNEHNGEGDAPPEGKPAVVELAGLVVRRAPVRASVLAVRGQELDLVAAAHATLRIGRLTVGL